MKNYSYEQLLNRRREIFLLTKSTTGNYFEFNRLVRRHQNIILVLNKRRFSGNFA